MGVIKNYELPFVLDNIFVTEMGIFINVDGENCLISEKMSIFTIQTGALDP